MIAGVDGCKGGWLVAIADRFPASNPPALQVCPDFAAVLEATRDCRVVAIDMPIGIPSGSAERRADADAKRLLDRHGAASRVFPTAPREAMEAGDYPEFLERHWRLRGKGISKQAWAIVPRIRDIDAHLTPQLQERVHEYHPELAWKHLAGEVLLSKHTAAGLLQRVHMIEKASPGITRVWNGSVGARASLDDVLDALIGLSVAQAIADGPDASRRVPLGEVPRDEKGLRMEIWF